MIHGSDYNKDCASTSRRNSTEHLKRPICKVRFDDNRSYWYIGQYSVGDLVYVEGLKQGCLGQVKAIYDTNIYNATYRVVECVGHVDLSVTEEVKTIWNSYKAKEKRAFLQSMGMDISATEKQFISLVENLWIEFAQKINNWDLFKCEVLKVREVIE